MRKEYESRRPLRDLHLWEVLSEKRALFSFELEITARCNLNCKHCYINLPANHAQAARGELSTAEITRIAREAVSLGALWCLITGGEPLRRADFFDIYLALKRLGLLVSVFTNATLITPKHVGFFKRYPPRDIETTVYGVTEATYERITRRRGSYEAFRRGLDLLAEAGIPVTLKAMAIRSNLDEMQDIIRFCREWSGDSFRFDPFLHLRYDGIPERNREIVAERLSPDEVVRLEEYDRPRFKALKAECGAPIDQGFAHETSNRLFRCGVGRGSFCLSYDGIFRFCSTLWHPACTRDLRGGRLDEAWNELHPVVRSMESTRREYAENCRVCPMINLCRWCPAVAYLETGQLDSPVEGYCRIAHARVESFSTR